MAHYVTLSACLPACLPRVSGKLNLGNFESQSETQPSECWDSQEK